MQFAWTFSVLLSAMFSKTFFKDKCPNFKGTGPDFLVVVGNIFLMIGGHQDGCTFSYFICLVQVSPKFLTFVPLTLHDGSGCGHAYFGGDNCVYLICESERSVSCWLSRCCPVGPQDVGQLFHPLLFGFF